MSDRSSSTVEVKSTDPEQSEEEKQRRLKEVKELEAKGMDIDEDEEDDDLSAEDRKLKADLEMLVERLTERGTSAELRAQALTQLATEIRTSTSSMTSIPKPLKFLRPFYEPIKEFYASKEAAPIKVQLADVLSVLAMTMAEEDTLESLKFKLQGDVSQLGVWGHEYVRHLAGEIGTEYQKRVEAQKSYNDLNQLIDGIVPFNMLHNAETDACDLLIEVDQCRKVLDFVTADNCARVCSYLTGCAEYSVDQEDREKLLMIVYDAYRKASDLTNALRIALKLHNRELVSATFAATDDALMKKQLGFILASHRLYMEEFEDEDDELAEIVGNVHLTTHYAHLAQELDVQEAKTPEDVYKRHLEESGGGFSRRNRSNNAPKVDSAKQNLASTFVNAFVNVGYGKDLLVTPEGSDWLYKNKDHGMLSAAASLGMILLWDLETGYSSIDKYSFSAQSHIKAGALLATGMIGSGVTSEMDASLALLSDHVTSDNPQMQVSAVLGLGFAYAGSARDDVLEILMPVVLDGSQSMEASSMTVLSLGLVFCGTAHEDLSTTIIECLIELNDTQLNDSTARLMSLGLGLLFLGKGEACEATLEALQVIQHPLGKFAALTVETCAHAGTGSVLQVQRLLSICGEHLETDEASDAKDDEKKADNSKKEESTSGSSSMHQAVAVLGIAMVTMGENLGAQLALRSFDHILQYCEVNVRRAVPLALGLLSISNPQLPVMDTLSKLSHDQDEEVSQNACLALGFLGAGTNNSRIANLLRQLAAFYAKEANHLFLVRIAQGLLHMGKGLVTLSPFHSDSGLMTNVAMAGLLVVFHAAIDMKNSILGKRHYLLYSLVTAVRPRMLITVNEDLEPLPVKVRVGQAVDTVAQAGKPKTITGFQTHSTPVLLAAGDRAELGTDEYIALTNVLEGVVICKKNPNATVEE